MTAYPAELKKKMQILCFIYPQSDNRMQLRLIMATRRTKRTNTEFDMNSAVTIR